MGRDLDWDGCFNVRDLGGLPLHGGGRTRWGGLVRSDALDGLSQPGWGAVLRQSGPQFGTPLYYRAHLERFPTATRP